MSPKAIHRAEDPKSSGKEYVGNCRETNVAKGDAAGKGAVTESQKVPQTHSPAKKPKAAERSPKIGKAPAIPSPKAAKSSETENLGNRRKAHVAKADLVSKTAVTAGKKVLPTDSSGRSPPEAGGKSPNIEKPRAAESAEAPQSSGREKVGDRHAEHSAKDDLVSKEAVAAGKEVLTTPTPRKKVVKVIPTPDYVWSSVKSDEAPKSAEVYQRPPSYPPPCFLCKIRVRACECWDNRTCCKAPDAQKSGTPSNKDGSEPLPITLEELKPPAHDQRLFIIRKLDQWTTSFLRWARAPACFCTKIPYCRDVHAACVKPTTKVALAANPDTPGSGIGCTLDCLTSAAYLKLELIKKSFIAVKNSIVKQYRTRRYGEAGNLKKPGRPKRSRLKSIKPSERNARRRPGRTSRGSKSSPRGKEIEFAKVSTGKNAAAAPDVLSVDGILRNAPAKTPEAPAGVPAIPKQIPEPLIGPSLPPPPAQVPRDAAEAKDPADANDSRSWGLPYILELLQALPCTGPSIEATLDVLRFFLDQHREIITTTLPPSGEPGEGGYPGRAPSTSFSVQAVSNGNLRFEPENAGPVIPEQGPAKAFSTNRIELGTFTISRDALIFKESRKDAKFMDIIRMKDGKLVTRGDKENKGSTEERKEAAQKEPGNMPEKIKITKVVVMYKTLGKDGDINGEKKMEGDRLESVKDGGVKKSKDPTNASKNTLSLKESGLTALKDGEGDQTKDVKHGGAKKSELPKQVAKVSVNPRVKLFRALRKLTRNLRSLRDVGMSHWPFRKGASKIEESEASKKHEQGETSSKKREPSKSRGRRGTRSKPERARVSRFYSMSSSVEPASSEGTTSERRLQPFEMSAVSERTPEIEAGKSGEHTSAGEPGRNKIEPTSTRLVAGANVIKVNARGMMKNFNKTRRRPIDEKGVLNGQLIPVLQCEIMSRTSNS